MFGAKYGRLFYWIISIILLMIGSFFLGFGKDLVKVDAPQGATISFAISFITNLIWINTLANRIRDCGGNPWLSLLGLVPLANLILGIYYGIENKKNRPIQNNTSNKENPNNDVSLSKAIYNHAKDLSTEIKPAINQYKEKHSNSNPNTNSFINEDEIYEKVLLEIEENRKVKSTWAKALSQSDGDDKKAESIYIKERVSFILNEQNTIQSNNTSNNFYIENVENLQNKSSNEKLITSLIVGLFILIVVLPISYYKINTNNEQQISDSKLNIQSFFKNELYFKADITDLVLNLTDSNGKERLMKLSFSIKSSEPTIAAIVEELKPEIVDVLITLVSSRSSEELLTVGGRDLLKDELLQKINNIVNEGTKAKPEVSKNNVKQIFFTTFAIK